MLCKSTAIRFGKRATFASILFVLVTGCVYDEGPPTHQSSKRPKSKYVLVSNFDENTPHDKDFVPAAAANAQEPITDIPLASVSQVGNQLENDDLVLGVAIEGESRAYPIAQLCGPQREIINDELGGRAIAATW